MILYFLKSSFLFLVFYLIYVIALDKKKSSVFKRYYLLSSFIVSSLLPLAHFHFEITSNKISTAKEYAAIYITEITPILLEKTEPQTTSIVLWLYIGISFVFMIRFCYHVYAIKTIKTEQIVHPKFGRIVLHQKKVSPFSFLETIYIQKNKWDQDGIGEEILYHEMAHVVQKHTIDVLLVEFFKIFIWFQPFVYVYRKKITQNHEYLADEFAISQTENIQEYQQSLLDYYIESADNISLTSSFYFNNLKKRFIMMKMSKKASVKEVIFYSSTILFIYIGLVGIDAKASEIKKVEKRMEKILENIHSIPEEKDYTLLENYQMENISQNTTEYDASTNNPEQQTSQNHIVQEVDEKANPKEGLQIFYKSFINVFKLSEKYRELPEIKFILRFVVNIDGSFSEIKAHSTDNKEYILHEKDLDRQDDSYYFECLKAAIIALKQMPKWNPALKDGKQVVSNFAIPVTLKTKNDSIYSNAVVDKRASPQNGIENFYQYIIENLDLSDWKSNSNFTIDFVVEEDGSLSNVHIKKGLGNTQEQIDAYEKQLKEVFKNSPKWNPAIKDDKPVRSSFVLPVKLRESKE